MCEKAVEIQRNYSIPEVGDFILCKHGLEIVHDYRYEDENLVVIVDCESIIEFTKDQFIWLPRQDQLQGLLKKDYEFRNGVSWQVNLMTRGFADYCYQFKDMTQFNMKVSLEQIWLMFVMKKLFSKEWDGAKWL
jgi:hypothetical protein